VEQETAAIAVGYCQSMISIHLWHIKLYRGEERLLHEKILNFSEMQIADPGIENNLP
jgi:hypothetical protein